MHEINMFGSMVRANKCMLMVKLFGCSFCLDQGLECGINNSRPVILLSNLSYETVWEAVETEQLYNAVHLILSPAGTLILVCIRIVDTGVALQYGDLSRDNSMLVHNEKLDYNKLQVYFI